MALKAPFPWFGGKSRAADLIWPRFGDVNNYVEPFAGSLAVLLAAPEPVANETVNDKDAFVANFWRALRADPEAVAAAADYPVSEVDLHSRHAWLVQYGRPLVERLLEDPEAYDARIAGWWVWGQCLWIGGGWCADRPAVHKRRPWVGRGGRGVNAAGQIPNLANAGKGVHRATLHGKVPYLDNGGRGLMRAELAGQVPYLDQGGRGVHRAQAGDLRSYLGELAARLRRTRVVCGDWSRVVTPAVTFQLGMTAVLLDPPYADTAERAAGLYAHDDLSVAHAVREWAIANGDNPMLRIALCGYEGEHEMPSSWECVPWKAKGGYGSQGTGKARDNATRERIWFSPACCKPDAQPSLFDLIRGETA